VSAVASLATARARRTPARRVSRAYAAVDGPVDVALLRISRQLAAHSMTVREAADHVRSLYLKTELARARVQCANMPGPLARAHFVAESARAARDVLADEFASAVPLALAERRLGQVLVLPCGERVGPTEKPYDRPEDLW
jgi:2-keto-4-pentenoate hydratase